MDSIAKNEISTREIIYFLLFLLLTLGTQVLVIDILSKYAALIIVSIILFLLSIIFYLGYLRDLSVYLLVVNFFPLLILDNNLHYDFHLELISFVPLIGLMLLAVFLYILNEKDISFSLSYIGLPVLALVIYFGIGAIIAASQGKDSYWILIEYTHFCLYLIIFPVVYLLRHREKYLMVMKFLLWLSILISLQYIIFDLFVFQQRFVTFQSGFLPLTIGVVFAYYLFNNNRNKKLVAIFALLILIAGTFVTLTRTLWVVTFLIMLSILLIYLKHNNKLTIFKTCFVLLILVIPILISGDTANQVQKKPLLNQSLKARTESISDPLQDASFLMRVELGYYAVQDFLKKPIFGNAIGSYVRYKIFVFSPLPVYYIDSSWLYMLWKGGIIGFLLFAWLFFRFFKAAFYVLKNSKDINAKIIALGLIGGFIGMVFLGLLSPLLIKYKTNALLAFLFAYIEFERRVILTSETKNPLEFPSP